MEDIKGIKFNIFHRQTTREGDPCDVKALGEITVSDQYKCIFSIERQLASISGANLRIFSIPTPKKNKVSKNHRKSNKQKIPSILEGHYIILFQYIVIAFLTITKLFFRVL